MRKITMIRLGLASLVVTAGAVSALVVGCSSDSSSGDNPSPSPTGTDGGPGTDGSTSPTTPGEGGPGNPDAGDATPPPAPKPARIALLHAAANLDGIKLCLGTGTDETAPLLPIISPAPADKPDGIPAAGGGVFDPIAAGVPASSVAALASTDLTVWAIQSKDLTDAEKAGKCSEALDTFKTKGFYIGAIPKGTLKDDSSFLVAITGCSKDADPANAALNGRICGVGWDAAKGNLALAVIELDAKTAVDSKKLGAQFLNMSSQSISIPSFKDGVVPAFFVPPPAAPSSTDAGVPVPDAGSSTVTSTPPTLDIRRLGAGNSAYGDKAPIPAAAAEFDGLLGVGAYAVAYAPGLWAGGTPTTLPDPTKGAIPVPFDTVELVSTGDPAQVGKWLAAGKAYTFILIGDPLSAATSGKNPKIRIIALPNN